MSGQEIQPRQTGLQDYAGVLSGELGSAVTGLLALTPAGDTIAAFNPETLFIPASNMKLITTGLALDVLGSGYVYETVS